MNSVDFENYTETSENYQRERVPIAASDYLQVIREHFGQSKTQQLSILDAGCGTGNYLNYLHPHVATSTGLDINEAMLNAAKKSLAHCPKIKFVKGSLTEQPLPFENETFDVILINQVLQHLAEKCDFRNVEKAMKEFWRIMKKGGLLLLNHCFPGQVTTLWYAVIIPEAFQLFESRLIPKEELEHRLYDLGFREIQIWSKTDLAVKQSSYTNLEGPFSKSWRDATSLWALATEQELEKGLRWFAELPMKTKLELFSKKEKEREEFGLSSVIKAVKPL